MQVWRQNLLKTKPRGKKRQNECIIKTVLVEQINHEDSKKQRITKFIFFPLVTSSLSAFVVLNKQPIIILAIVQARLQQQPFKTYTSFCRGTSEIPAASKNKNQLIFEFR